MIANKLVPAILTVVGLAACGKSSSTDTVASVAAAGAPSGKVTASTVADLNLTGALNITLPESLAGAGLRLAEGAKSMEACLMRSNIKDLVQQVDMVKTTLCSIEAEGDNIPWNKPVLLDTSGMGLVDPEDSSGPGEAPLIGIYADSSVADKVAVYICQGETTATMKLMQAFKIDGSKSITKDGKIVKTSKGTVNMAFEMGDLMSMKGAIGFDSNYTNADTTALKFQMKMGMTGMSFAINTDLVSKDSGESKISISQTGTFSMGDSGTGELPTGDGDPGVDPGIDPGAGPGGPGLTDITFTNIGVGMFDAENGNVFYSSQGAGTDFNTHACVDSASKLVSCDSAKFAVDGALYVTAADVPGVLKSDFTPAAPTGFDCATADWSTKLAPSADGATAAAHEACYANITETSDGGGMSECFEGFENSGAEVTIEAEEVEPADSLEPVLSL